MALVIGLGGPAAAQLVVGRTYELRTYHAADGRLNELHARFRQHSLPLLQRHGIEVVGTWVPKPNPDNAVVALMAYASAAAREASWSQVVGDPAWTAMKRRTDGRGLLVESVEELPLSAVTPLVANKLHGDLELRTHARANRTPAGAVAAWVPTRPRADLALVSLHPRKVELAANPGITLVTALMPAAGEQNPHVTVLSPTDYSPAK
jgi:hypothetical protein